MIKLAAGLLGAALAIGALGLSGTVAWHVMTDLTLMKGVREYWDSKLVRLHLLLVALVALLLLFCFRPFDVARGVHSVVHAVMTFHDD